MMIIDSQVHIWGPNTPERPWDREGQRRIMDEPATAAKLNALDGRSRRGRMRSWCRRRSRVTATISRLAAAQCATEPLRR